jgi:beta-galactosidase GanA
LLWRGFLRKRYSTLEALNLAHGTSFSSFEAVEIPSSLLAASTPLADWNDFVAEKTAAWRDFAQQALGFIPRSLGDGRTRWRDFLASRYSDVDELNAAYLTAYESFESVPLPGNAPAGSQRDDWDDFLRLTAGTAGAAMRRRWQDFLARRYRRISALNGAYDTAWRGFDDIAIPDELPLREAALADWYQFESVVLTIEAAAHRFAVLLPAPKQRAQTEFQQKRDLATRIVNWEKPAHTVFDVKFYWAMFQVGAARLSYDTLIDVGSRAPDLLSPMVVGQGYLAEGYLMDERDLAGRNVLGRDCLTQRQLI